MAFQGDSIFWVEVEKIVPNPFQPRREFDEEKLKELAESVRMYGILQPLTVTRREIQNEDGSFRSEYELIAGERRLRASKLAGVAQVPVIIREGEQSEQEKLELAIIENLQREDLNAVDRAIAFRQLADVFGLSHMQVAKKMGRSREYVSNSIRILALPDYMLSAIRTGDITEGHARALLMLNDRPEELDTVFREVLLKKLSVREVERIARHIATDKIRKKGEYDPDLIEMEKKFTETLGTRVSIVKTDFGGRLSIDYFTQEELEGILEGMLREPKKISGHAVPMRAQSVALGPLTEPGTLGVPRADELAILTERTGLELVPEIKPPVPIISVPVAEVELELPIEVSMPPAPVLVETEQLYEAEVSKMQPVVAAAIEHTSSDLVVPPQITQAPAVEVVPLVAPVPSILPVMPTSPVTLRDQLAVLLNKNSSVAEAITLVSTVANTASVAPVPVVPDMQTPPVNQPIIPVTPVGSVQTAPDESDLYSIRDFSI